MKNKAEAEKTETRLLNTYDYACNKGNNGVRRLGDVFQKLDRHTSSSIQFLTLAKTLSRFHQKKIDVNIDTCKPLSWEDGSRIYTNWESNDLLPRIFKYGRSQPRLVTPSLGFNDDHASICGVALGYGSVCTRPPVGGRKRCDAHQGMKIIDFPPKKLLTEGKSLVNSSPSCRVTLDDGSVCRKPPVQGRKRCEDLKGRKITGSLSSESVTNGKTQHYVNVPVLEAPISLETKSPVFSEKSVTSTKLDTICGVDLDNGTFCTKRPVVGRKRCEEHYRMRANYSKLPSVFDSPNGNSTHQSVPYRSVVKEDYSSTCGATSADGSACRRPPAKGKKGVGSIKACGAIPEGLIVSPLCMILEEFHQIYVRPAQGMGPSAVERLSVETGGVSSTKGKEPPSKLCCIDSSTSVWYGYVYKCPVPVYAC